MSWQNDLTHLGYPPSSKGIYEFQQDYNVAISQAVFAYAEPLPETGVLTQYTQHEIHEMATGLTRAKWEHAIGRAWRLKCMLPYSPGTVRRRRRGAP